MRTPDVPVRLLNSSIRTLAAACCAFALVATSRAQSAPPTPTHVVDYTAPVFPDASGDFEDTTIVRQEYAPSWAPWTMSPQSTFNGIISGAGIAKNGATVLAQSDPAPQGVYVCFVEGVASAQCNFVFAPGTWKLRFKAAQRQRGTTADQQLLRVTIGGTNVFEQVLPSKVFAEYVTSVVNVTTATTLTVSFTGLNGSSNANTVLIDHILLEREFPWNSAATWGTAQPPDATSKVRIGPGADVYMDGTCLAESTEVQGKLRARGSNASLETKWVLVHGDSARFLVGSEAAPFQYDFTLTLIGAPSPENIMGGGTKFLMAMDGGVIEMHGKPRVSWSKLTNLTSVGVATIHVEDQVDWTVGDRVVIARTATMHQDATDTDPQQSEDRTIVSVNAGNGDLYLNTATTYPHCFAPPITYPTPLGNKVLDERAEVGLLTHNVRVEAKDDANATTSKFGGHVMLMNCPMCITPGQGRFSHVAFRRMGQEFAFGRYPLHWHMQMANGLGQYARGCSIWQSYNRAIVVHGTDNLTIEDNVCFDQVGHAIFLEDGGERHNHFVHNLVLRTLRPPANLALLPHDASHDEAQNRSPAVFWITNPENYFVGNVAADTIGTGYWFALHRQPFNQSSDLTFTQGYFAPGGQPLDATTLPLGAFDDNVTHAVRNGIDLNDSVDPHTMTQPLQHDDTLEPNVAWFPSQPAVLQRFVAHGCATALYAGGGPDGSPSVDGVTFTDSILADNEWDVQFACAFTVASSLFVAQSNTGVFSPTHPAFTGVAFVPYDGPARVIDSHWVGFSGPDQWSPMAVTTVFGAAQRHTNHVLQGITKPAGSAPFRVDSMIDFANEQPNADPTKPCPADSRHWGIAIRDPDGGVTNFTGGTPVPDLTLVTDHPMMRMSGLSALHPDVLYPTATSTDPNLVLTPMRCSWYRWGYLLMTHHEGNGAQLPAGEQPTMVFTRPLHDGCASVSFTEAFQVDDHRQLPIIVRRAADTGSAECWYKVEWTPPSNAKKLRVRVQNLASGDVGTLEFKKLDGWTGESVWVNGVQLTSVGTTPALLAGLTSTAYARRNQSLWLRTVVPATPAGTTAEDVWIYWQ